MRDLPKACWVGVSHKRLSAVGPIRTVGLYSEKPSVDCGGHKRLSAVGPIRTDRYRGLHRQVWAIGHKRLSAVGPIRTVALQSAILQRI